MISKEVNIAPALERGLTILEMLAASSHPIGFSKFAGTLSLSNASASRLLRVLRKRGYAVKDEQSGKYRCGPKMAMLGHRTAFIDRLRKEAGPILRSLAEKTHNSCALIFWDGRRLQWLAKEVNPASIPMAEIGRIQADLSQQPWGWLFYGALDEEQKEKALEDMEDKQGFLKAHPGRVDYYQKHSYFYDDREIIKSIRRFASPVYRQNGKLGGALGVGGNPLTIPNNQVKYIGRLLAEHARQLSTNLGWMPV